MNAPLPAVLEPGAPCEFPPDAGALAEPNGLIAIGGDLSPERLVAAYRRGIFPWYESGQPILWWTPEPRLILRPARLHVSRSLRKRIRHKDYSVEFDTDFSAVIRACAEPREDSPGTWITPGMIDAYLRLHRLGIAHSVEVRRGDRLIGGLYGLAIGAVFFGESMFSRETDASKIALQALCESARARENALIDCQVPSRHLCRLGAEPVPRSEFTTVLQSAVDAPSPWPFKIGNQRQPERT